MLQLRTTKLGDYIMNTLKERLKEFKLAGLLNSLDERIAYATSNSLSYVQFLEILYRS